MDKPWFSLELKPETQRTMNREQYCAARSWLRYVAREIRRARVFKKNMEALNNGHSYGWPPHLNIGMQLLAESERQT